LSDYTAESPVDHDPLEVAFSKDTNVLPLADELFSLPLLRTLIVSTQSPQVLIANNENRCVLRYTIVNAASCRCSKIRCLTSRNRQRTRENKDLAKKLTIRIAIHRVPQVAVSGRMDRLRHTNKPLLGINSRLRHGSKQQKPGAPRVFKCIVGFVIDAKTCRNIAKPIS
jgi:hypothetical protein